MERKKGGWQIKILQRCSTNGLEIPTSLVSFAAVIRVVTQRSSPLTAAHSSSAFLSLKLTNKEQASISWKPGPCCVLAANVTINMIGAAANNYTHVIGSQQQRERNTELE